LLIACGGEAVTPPDTMTPMLPPMMPPDMQPDPMPSIDCTNAPAAGQVSGDVSGFWTGRVELTGPATVPAGEKLEICPGTVIAPSQTAKLIVKGELAVSGTREAMVTFEEIRWGGIDVEGKLTGGYFTMTGAGVCITGRTTSEIDLVATMLLGCGQGFALANGARLDRMTVLGGSSLYITGGILTMVDSTVDFRHPNQSPDCMVWAGGGANFDHVHVTGCHCPLHMGRGDMGIQITNSILDGGAVPFMIANTSGVFTGNNVIGGSPQLMDIGGNISIDAGGNYWGGGAALVSGARSQYSNLDDYAATPIEGAGPR
jgi:hypothetical protein